MVDRVRRRWESLLRRRLRLPLRPGPLPRSMAVKVARAAKVEKAGKAGKAEPWGLRLPPGHVGGWSAAGR